MRNKENIKELLEYFQTSENKIFQFDEESIVKAYQKNNSNQSLAIKILSVFGGLLACLAFLGFLLMIGLYDSSLGLIIFGVLFLIGAIWINKEYDQIILDTVSVSFYIVGFILLGFGLSKFGMSENEISVIFILTSLLSLRLTQNYILSFVSVLIVNASFLTLIIVNNHYNLIHLYVPVLTLLLTYIFVKEAKIITHSKLLSKLYDPIRIGLIFSLLSGLVMIGKRYIIPLSPNYLWVSFVIILLAVIYLISHLLEILDITKTQHKTTIHVLSVVILLPTALSPAISGAILILLLSFLVNYKTGLTIGIISFIYFISQYYYDLNYSLLAKSIFLFSSGILFICIYLLTHKKLTSNEKV